jgi:hypothetical protein
MVLVVQRPAAYSKENLRKEIPTTPSPAPTPAPLFFRPLPCPFLVIPPVLVVVVAQCRHEFPEDLLPRVSIREWQRHWIRQ